jgi:Ala-tRNA(Pro) deacylase
LASEVEFKGLFPDCQIGTMPPFGNLYEVPVYVDQLLAEDEEIVFEAGTHLGAIKLRYRDFADLVHPTLAEFHQAPAKIAE